LAFADEPVHGFDPRKELATLNDVHYPEIAAVRSRRSGTVRQVRVQFD
jgi:hypothetical protein